MKNKIIILSMSLCLLLASTAIGFAAEEPIKIVAPNGEPTVTNWSGLSITAVRKNASYATMTFVNSTSSSIVDTVRVYDTVEGISISGPFDIRVQANGKLVVDVYVGSYNNVEVKTKWSGDFNVRIR